MADDNLAKLTPKQIQLLDAMLAGSSIADATKQVGVHRQTAYLWIDLPAFQDEMIRAKALIHQSNMQTIMQLQQTAIATLGELMAPTKPDGIRLSAAKEAMSVYLELMNAEVGDPKVWPPALTGA